MVERENSESVAAQVEQEDSESFVAKVDSQNRITISKHVRDLLGIRPGIKVRANISLIKTR